MVALFIMLTAALTTQLIRSIKMKKFYHYVLLLDALAFVGGVALFIWSYSPVFMVIGMVFAVAVLGMTIFKYTDF
jgi:hypothetical protein